MLKIMIRLKKYILRGERNQKYYEHQKSYDKTLSKNNQKKNFNYIK